MLVWPQIKVSTAYTLIYLFLSQLRDSLVSQMVKHLPAMQKTRVRSLGQEDPLEKEMATQSNILA